VSAPDARRLRALAAGILVSCFALATPTRALPPSPVYPFCLATVGTGSFAGHAFPLDSIPDPGPVTLVDAYPGLTFSAPIYAAVPPDGSRRLFVVERAGRIQVIENGVKRPTPFVDISSFVATAGEQGLLSMAFAPDYATSGLFYLYYSANIPVFPTLQGATFIVRMRVGADPNVADPDSIELLLYVAKPGSGANCVGGSLFTNHNGGTLAFGPDGYLYLAPGDGGGGGDVCNFAQNRKSMLGKMLRIDVSGGPGSGYTIPPGNPFAGALDPGDTTLDEIWALGLRNPYRFSFDRLTGDLWIGDVGQDRYEEVDREPAGSGGGRNYGWRRMEGFHCFNPSSGCDDGSLTPPLFEYDRDYGRSITGGIVYRGDALPSLFGAYLFADFISGRVRAYPSSQPGASPIELTALAGIAAIVEDAQGEPLFVNLFDGRLYRLQVSTGGSSQFPALLSQTGLFASTASLTPKPGLFAYAVSTSLWSDGAEKWRWLALPASGKIAFSASGGWTFPTGTVFVKHFELPLAGGGRTRVETRVLLRQLERWIAYTYRWNGEQTDASLVTQAQTASYSVDHGQGPVAQTWTFPGPADCLTCHTEVEGRVLGVRTAQSAVDWACESRTENQLSAWAALGLFSNAVGSPTSYLRYSDPTDASQPLGARARSYLAANCAMCHQPGGPAPGGMDLRFATDLAGMNVVNVPPTQGNLGLDSPMRLLPGDHARSMLWHRVQTPGPGRMPQLSSLPDALAIAFLGEWIDSDPTQGGDADGDGVPDDVDNCVRIANANQSDFGGLGAGSGPDGIGDACQCGDVSGDGRVTANDASLIARAMLVPPSATLTRPTLCDVGGTHGCSTADAAIVQRALLQPPLATIAPACATP